MIWDHNSYRLEKVGYVPRDPCFVTNADVTSFLSALFLIDSNSSGNKHYIAATPMIAYHKRKNALHL